jgi:hypothetical protein
MANIEISGLPATAGLATTDQFPTKKGTLDYRANLGQLVTLVTDNFTAAELLTLLLTVDSDSSTLNSNFLQGATKAFFTSASNLNAGTVPDARLPNQTITTSGGINDYNEPFSVAIPLPAFMFGGTKVMVQAGLTEQYLSNTDFTITYPIPFTGGFGYSYLNDASPIFLVTPYGITVDANPAPSERVEVGVGVYKTTLSYANCSTYRRSGKSYDYAKAFWFAIGKY